MLSIKKPLQLSLVALMAYGLWLTASAGERPILILTWQADNYTPSFYQGKKLPSGGTPVKVALQLSQHKILQDLSQKEIRWFLNNQLSAAGVGRTTFTFTTPHLGESGITIRAQVRDYHGEDLDGFLAIPIVQPEVVIDQSALPTLKGLFYFFNINNETDLDIDWEDNSQSITLKAQNRNNPLESAQTTLLKSI